MEYFRIITDKQESLKINGLVDKCIEHHKKRSSSTNYYL
jgi:hypothetical protein